MFLGGFAAVSSNNMMARQIIQNNQQVEQKIDEVERGIFNVSASIAEEAGRQVENYAREPNIGLILVCIAIFLTCMIPYIINEIKLEKELEAMGSIFSRRVRKRMNREKVSQDKKNALHEKLFEVRKTPSKKIKYSDFFKNGTCKYYNPKRIKVKRNYRHSL